MLFLVEVPGNKMYSIKIIVCFDGDDTFKICIFLSVLTWSVQSIQKIHLFRVICRTPPFI